MLSALATLIDRRPWWVPAIALAISAVAAPISIHVRDNPRRRGFDVADDVAGIRLDTKASVGG